jgi:hypothetical protein
MLDRMSLGIASVSNSIPAPAQTHESLYECCAALIIAVMVVLYFDERVRRDLSARLRGYAIGSLGGLIGTGLLVPLFALAGFMHDTTAVRAFTVGYTLVFLIAAFGVAIRSWGREDAARLQPARPAPLPPLPLPAPRAGMTEREHAAEVLGAAMSIAALFRPETVLLQLSRTGPVAELERLTRLTAQWYTLQPSLIAITAGYPAALVRERIGVFVHAVSEVVQQPAVLFSSKDALADDQARVRWGDEATTKSEYLMLAWDQIVSALHARQRPGAKAIKAAARDGHPAPSAVIAKAVDR